jgi:carbonic anhydrase/acetyltransferase-like protein (isoleucine patch superfamily)
VVGDVSLADDVSVWYGCVLRGDVNRIEIRERSNVQDGSVIHLGDEHGTLVAEEVVVGHRAVIHGCQHRWRHPGRASRRRSSTAR